MTPPAGSTVALVDDDDDLREAIAQSLSLTGFAVRQFADAPSALAAIDGDFAGVVVTDVRMPRMSGIDLFRALKARDAELPIILMTGHGDVPMAVDALKAGAWDFLTKPFDPDILIAAVKRAATTRALALDNRLLQARVNRSETEDFVGDAPAIRQLRAMIPLLADATLDIVIEGQTGTGKALLAHLIHRAGRRARQRLTAVDCATVPPAVVTDELFARNGIVARASRSTLLFENLGMASQELQRRLAAFLDARAVGLGLREPDPVDVRVIATLAEGDRDRVEPALYHRLAGVPLHIPPLAQRRDDIALLFMHLARRTAEHHGCALPPPGDLPHRLAARDWPGNVRELGKLAERWCLGIEPSAAAPTTRTSLTARMDGFERAAIIDAIEASGGEIAAAIDALGIPRKTFYYRVNRLGIDLKALRAMGRMQRG